MFPKIVNYWQKNLVAQKSRVICATDTVYAITFGSGKQLFPGLTATGINSVTPLNNPGGPEGDTVTVDEQLLNTEY